MPPDFCCLMYPCVRKRIAQKETNLSSNGCTYHQTDEPTYEERKEDDVDMTFVGQCFQYVEIQSSLETCVDVTAYDACTHKDASKERKFNLYVQLNSKTVCECASVPIQKKQRQA
jgi:hypothetical protein